MSPEFSIQLLFVLFGLLGLGATTAIAKLVSDVRMWRDAEREMRDLWNWERERSSWLRAQLEDERKRYREGVYR